MHSDAHSSLKKALQNKRLKVTVSIAMHGDSENASHDGFTYDDVYQPNPIKLQLSNDAIFYG